MEKPQKWRMALSLMSWNLQRVLNARVRNRFGSASEEAESEPAWAWRASLSPPAVPPLPTKKGLRGRAGWAGGWLRWKWGWWAEGEMFSHPSHEGRKVVPCAWSLSFLPCFTVLELGCGSRTLGQNNARDRRRGQDASPQNTLRCCRRVC